MTRPYHIIRDDSGHDFRWEGPLPQGMILNRRAPALFRLSDSSVVELKEELDPIASLCYPAIRGTMRTSLVPGEGFGLITTYRKDGSEDNTPLRFYHNALGGEPAPPDGAPIAFRCHVSTNRKIGRGRTRSPHDSRFVNVCQITIDDDKIKSAEKGTMNPALLDYLYKALELDVDILCRPVDKDHGASPSSYTAHDAIRQGNPSVMQMIGRLEMTATDTETDEKRPVETTQAAHAFLRRTKSQTKKLRILILPRGRDPKSTPAGWLGKLHRELDTDPVLRSCVRDIYVALRISEDVTESTLLTTNTDLLSNIFTNPRNHYTCDIICITTPTYEGTYDTKQHTTVHKHASAYHSYALVHLQPIIRSVAVPRVHLLDMTDFNISVPDNVSEGSVLGSAGVRVSFPHITEAQTKQTQAAIVEMAAGCNIEAVITAGTDHWTTYAIDTSFQTERTDRQIAEQLNGIQTAIAMTADAQRDGAKTHFVMIMKKTISHATHEAVMVLEALGAGLEPATARLASENTIVFESSLPPSQVVAEITDFVTRNKEDIPSSCILAVYHPDLDNQFSPINPLPPPRPQRDASQNAYHGFEPSFDPSALKEMVIETRAVPTSYSFNNVGIVRTILNHFKVPTATQDSAVWVTGLINGKTCYAIKVRVDPSVHLSIDPICRNAMVATPHFYEKDVYTTVGRRVLSSPRPVPGEDEFASRDPTQSELEQEEKARAMHDIVESMRKARLSAQQSEAGIAPAQGAGGKGVASGNSGGGEAQTVPATAATMTAAATTATETAAATTAKLAAAATKATAAAVATEATAAAAEAKAAAEATATAATEATAAAAEAVAAADATATIAAAASQKWEGMSKKAKQKAQKAIQKANRDAAAQESPAKKSKGGHSGLMSDD